MQVSSVIFLGGFVDRVLLLEGVHGYRHYFGILLSSFLMYISRHCVSTWHVFACMDVFYVLFIFSYLCYMLCDLYRR